jgi:hypothetical protein
VKEYPLNRDQLRSTVQPESRRRRRMPPLLWLALHGLGFFTVAALFLAALIIIAEALRK